MDLIGQTIAGCEIISELGHGGMGAVYKARQPLLNRFVAVKVMAGDLAKDADFVARFRREASTAAQLNHQNMVLVFSAGEQNGHYYIVMEFVEGETLRQRIASHGRIEPREAIAIAVHVAEALKYAWSKSRLIHRDIKPDNIFLSTAGEVKVGDLGLAKNVGQTTAGLTQTGMAMGSPHYIAPEQARGQRDIDFRADIYSLGCTFYHMLTGQPPYDGTDALSIMMKHVSDPPPAIFKAWPTCPMPLAMLVGKMLKKNPRERHASYEELIAELTAVHDKLVATQIAAAAPPSGTITFLFTDIEGSSQLWEKHPQAMPVALERHNQILRQTMESHGGFVFKTVGDAFCVAFASAPNALAAALAAQRALATEPWGETGPLRVRMALHTGVADARGGDYFGPTLNRVARVLAAGHGGQILLSNATEQLVRDHLTEGVSLGDLGERSLKNLTRSEHIYQINLSDMPTQFPTLRAERKRAGWSSRFSGLRPDRLKSELQRALLIGVPVIIAVAGLLWWSPWKKPGSESRLQAEGASKQPAKAGTPNVASATENWQDWMAEQRKSGKLPSDVRDEGAAWITTKSKWSWSLKPLTPETVRDGAMRATFQLTYPGCGLSLRKSDNGRYQVIAATQSVDLMSVTGKDLREMLKRWPLPAGTDPEKAVTVEFRAVGGELSVKLNDIALGSVHDSTHREGAMLVYAPVAATRIHRIEVLNLDRVSTTENWHDWLAERRRGGRYADEFKDDGAAWVRPGTTTLMKPIRDGAVRATFTLPADNRASIGINLRHSGANELGQEGYQGYFSRTNVAVIRMEKDGRQTITTSPLPVGVDPDREMTCEFRAVGDELSCKLNGQTVATCRDSMLGQEGQVVLRCEGANIRFSRIEILNLDGASGTPAACTPPMTDAGTLANPQAGKSRLLDLGGGVTLELVGIPPGEFLLGSTKEEQAWAVANGARESDVKREGEAPRKATIKQGFWMGRTKVTVGQWKQFVAATSYGSEAEKAGQAWCQNPQTKTWENIAGKSWRDPNFGAPPEDNHAVCCVSWNDAVAFCAWLTDQDRKAGHLSANQVVRLPTEAEWEYACRAGTQTKFWWGEATEDGNNRLNWSGSADGFQWVSPVDFYNERGRNAFGLADILGNLYEWCLDEYDPKQAHEECYEHNRDARMRVLRGGAFTTKPGDCRCANRRSRPPSTSDSGQGFRVIVGLEPGATTATTPNSRSVDDAFLREVAALPAEQQVARVVAKLKELNPDFDGKVEPVSENNKVTGLKVCTVGVPNIAPVSALQDLRVLNCAGKYPMKGSLEDLSPLQGLKLEDFRCENNPVRDLSPLKGMPLTCLYIPATLVTDLTPLNGMRLERLNCNGTPITNLSPLIGAPLQTFVCAGSRVRDLSPLKGMRLTTLQVDYIWGATLDVLRGMPLEFLNCDFVPSRDTEILRSIKTLKKINNLPAAEFWKRVEAGEVPKTK